MMKSTYQPRTRTVLWPALGASALTLTLLACNSSNDPKPWPQVPPAPLITGVTPVDASTGVALDAKPSATFDRAMAPLTALTFALVQGTTPVAGAVTNSADGLTATFTPATPLAPSVQFTATIATGAKSAVGVNLAASRSWRFTTAAAVIAPTVVAVNPSANATGVAFTAPLIATFSKPLDPATVTTANFTLKQNGTLLPTSVTAGPGNLATLTPANALTPSTLYTATLGTGLKDLQGTALATPFSWTFTTAVAPDSTAPAVSSTTPAANATGVPFPAKLTVTFSEAMDPLTLTGTTFTVKDGATPLTGSLTYAASTRTATFTPAAVLAPSTLYAATLSTGVKDLAGNGLAAPYAWSFTSAAAPDTTPPTVSAHVPLANATNLDTHTAISATFNEAVNPLSVTSTSFTVRQGSTSVPGAITFGFGDTTATFLPSSPLVADTTYTVGLTTTIKDVSGNSLASAFGWSFTTAPLSAKGPAVVNLGTAGNYAILAQTGISSVPASAITGDIGLSPAASSFITGFSLTADVTNTFSTSPQIVGKAYAADQTVPTSSNLTTAVADMQTAYTDAAGRPTPDHLNLNSGNIGGLTLAPGLYNWDSTITIPANVTLNGGAKDIWIFQTTGDLSMASAQRVLLSGGALAKNVFWQVAGQVTLGTGAHFEGIILCKTQVTLQTLATLNGRILAQTLAAMDQATVTVPAL